MTLTEEKKKSGWRWGFYRWLVLIFIIASVIFSSRYVPIQPHFQVPAENLSAQPLFTVPLLNAPVYLSNTFVGIIIADVIVFLLALAVLASTRSKSLIPRGISGALEGLVEAIYNLTATNAGKWVRTIFPFFATIMLLVFVVNAMELLPGVDSVGLYHPEHVASIAACDVKTIGHLGDTQIVTVSGEKDCAEAVVPFVRVVSTDLNFPLALALVSVFSTQVIGVRALGLGYFKKFFNTSTLFKKPFLGAIDFFVGIIELVSEFIKILSFSFRLFGNVLVGTILLFVFGTLLPIFVPAGILVFNFLVGVIQAFVFGLLTMVFMSLATVSHHAEEGEH
jgi:F-type H+-transporting ATPase subunit a